MTFRRMWVILALFLPLLAAGHAAEEKLRLAVMEIQDQTGQFKPQAVAAATDRLRSKLSATGKYLIIDKTQQETYLKSVLAEQKKESRKDCYDQSCQIKLGQALAADTLLRSKITKLGKLCTLTGEMVDIEREVSITGGQADFDCTEEGLARSVDAVASQLTGGASQNVPAPTPSSGPKITGAPVTQANATLIVKVVPPEAVVTVKGPKGYQKRVMGTFNEQGLAPGTYQVTAEATGYETEERSIDLIPDDARAEKITMQKPGNLEVSGTPEGAQVEITGPKGFHTTQGLPVAVQGTWRGSYQIKVTRGGYDPWEQTAEVRPGETTRVSVRLQRQAKSPMTGEWRIRPGVPLNRFWLPALTDTNYSYYYVQVGDPDIARWTDYGQSSPSGEINGLGIFVAGSAACLGVLERVAQDYFMETGGDSEATPGETYIEKISRLPLTLGQVEVGDASFDRYNPELIRWVTENLLPDPNTPILGATYKALYRKVFFRNVRLFARVYIELKSKGRLDADAKTYEMAMHNPDFWGAGWLEERYRDLLPNYYPYLYGFSAPMAAGMWLRRHMDGSEAATAKAVGMILKLYDETFVREFAGAMVYFK